MKPDLTIEELIAKIKERASHQQRVLIAIAGPPGSGKSTLAKKLANELADELSVKTAIVPMDGFHLDNKTLTEMSLLQRKGAAETFDAKGFVELVQSLGNRVDISYPTFNRAADKTVPFGARVSKDTKIVLIEGNYLLLRCAGWNQLAEYFDLSAFIEAPREELEARLIKRWVDYGLSLSDATKRAQENDMKNVDFVHEHSAPADYIVMGNT